MCVNVIDEHFTRYVNMYQNVIGNQELILTLFFFLLSIPKVVLNGKTNLFRVPILTFIPTNLHYFSLSTSLP